ncbi:GD22485 [Drosophila simulans]|uniref:GD22485 n=2 Tax=Drosophila simulans TaxID=7240 RepID=B4Q5Q8_DROSI|nr:GD22485 [Drosophila simulans]
MSSYRTLVDHGHPILVGGCEISLASSSATSSPKPLHRMIKYWRNSSGKIPGLRKSESFAEYRRHSSNTAAISGGSGGRSSTSSARQLQYQRLEMESCENIDMLTEPLR